MDSLAIKQLKFLHCLITSLPQIFANLKHNFQDRNSQMPIHLDKKSKLFETNTIAIGTKESLYRKIGVKKHFPFFY